MLEAIHQFLPCETSQSWLDAAVKNLPELLIDHANCEKKAASTAMNLMYRHTQKPELMKKMSQLAREELLHFQQVVEILESYQIEYVRLSPSRYASGLRSLISDDPQKSLIEILVAGAFIEARSCERFAKLAPMLDSTLSKFYTSLLKSEARHFEDYLALARTYSDVPIDDLISKFSDAERDLINSPDPQLRFHSGVPA